MAERKPETGYWQGSQRDSQPVSSPKADWKATPSFYFIETNMLLAGENSVCAALRAVATWDASERLSGLRCPAIVIAGDAAPDLD